MLLSAGLPLPDRILVHGYVTVDGEKIGKSSGNAVDPIPLAAEFGADALRYYLLRHIRTGEDGDFSYDRLTHAYHADLAGQFGNLANRILSLIERCAGGTVPQRGPDDDLSGLLIAARRLDETVAGHVERFALGDGLAAIWDVVGQTNRHIARHAPWELARRASTTDGDEAEAAKHRLATVLHDLAAALEAIARASWPFMPSASERLLGQLGLYAVADRRALAGRRVRRGDVLFPRHDRETAAAVAP
jgi:methionyl-tRNA synthetase